LKAAAKECTSRRIPRGRGAPPGERRTLVQRRAAAEGVHMAKAERQQISPVAAAPVEDRQVMAQSAMSTT